MKFSLMIKVCSNLLLVKTIPFKIEYTGLAIFNCNKEKNILGSKIMWHLHYEILWLTRIFLCIKVQ